MLKASDNSWIQIEGLPPVSGKVRRMGDRDFLMTGTMPDEAFDALKKYLSGIPSEHERFATFVWDGDYLRSRIVRCCALKPGEWSIDIECEGEFNHNLPTCL